MIKVEPMASDLCNQEAEQAFIGCLLLDNNVALKYKNKIKTDHLHNESHRAILTAIQASEYVDVINISKILPISLKSLLITIHGSISTVGGIDSYLDMIKKAFDKKQMIILLNDVAEKLAEGQIAEAKNLIRKHSFESEENKLKTFDDMKEEYLKFLELQEKMAINLGYPSIDKATRGIKAGEVMTFLARSGVGKTTFALNIISNIESKIIFASLEMGSPQIFERLSAISLKENPFDIATNFQYGTKIAESISNLKHKYNNLRVLDKDKATIEDLENQIDNFKPSLLIIDYLGYLSGEGKTPYEKATYLAKEIKALAKRKNIAIILLCQTSRAGRSGGTEITLDTARDSGAIEESADYVLSAYRPELENNNETYEEGLFKVSILKNRCGQRGSFDFYFDKTTLRITEIGGD